MTNAVKLGKDGVGKTLCLFGSLVTLLLASRRNAFEGLGEVGLEILDDVSGTLEVSVLALNLVKLGAGRIVGGDNVRVVSRLGGGCRDARRTPCEEPKRMPGQNPWRVSRKLSSIDQLLGVGVEGVAPLAFGKVERLDGKRVDVSELRVNAVGDGLSRLERRVEEVLTVAVGGSEERMRLDGGLSKSERVGNKGNGSDLLESLAVVKGELGRRR